ncbi:MAG: hypothetical protein U0791_27815 [Gemmataceae bacterium]
MILVQYGKLGFLAVSPHASGFALARNQKVVVRTARGLEIGMVLSEDCRVSSDQRCEVVRIATLAEVATAERNEAFGQELLSAAAEAGLPVAFIDTEVSLDRAGAVLHALPFGECDASTLLAELSDRFGLAVRLLDLSRSKSFTDPPDPEKMTCGKPDCGTGSGCTSCSTGGCGTGSCSKGSVKSAAELTAYFTELREKMHARTPLV